MYLCSLREGKLSGCCKHGYKISGFINDGYYSTSWGNVSCVAWNCVVDLYNLTNDVENSEVKLVVYPNPCQQYLAAQDR
jgi:hypothetical protein